MTAEPTKSRAADAVVAELERQICAAELPLGSALPSERELMERFGTSRTVIREAIASLAGRGFLQLKARHRPRVQKPGFETALGAAGSVIEHLMGDIEGIKNLYQTREFIERGLVREAAQHASREHIQELKRALAANQQAIDDSARFYATDTDFHGVLYAMPDNPVFPALHRAVVGWLAPQWRLMAGSTQRNHDTFCAHRAIYLAILERDPDAAEQALRSHLQQSWLDVRETFHTAQD